MKAILVIERDHDTRVRVRRTLEGQGYFVVSATNNSDALGVLDKTSVPSIVLLGTDSALINGEQFLQIFRDNPAYASIPVIQLSDLGEVQLEGTCAYLQRPLKMGELLNAVQLCNP